MLNKRVHEWWQGLFQDGAGKEKENKRGESIPYRAWTPGRLFKLVRERHGMVGERIELGC
jgi:hypothetical protein